MSRISKMLKFLFNSDYRFLKKNDFGLNNNMPDEQYLKRLFKIRLGYELNLASPITFNEKLQWLKLYDRKPEYSAMVDKFAVKEYVSNLIGKEYIIPTLYVWDDPDDIDFDVLPNRFVLKLTHDSGGIVICKDKTQLDKQEALNIIKKSFRNEYFFEGREWPYKNVKHRIIAEEYMENSLSGNICNNENQGLIDYKVHCFNGVPKFILVCGNRYGKDGIVEDFYSIEWERLDIKRPNIQNAPNGYPKPELLAQMIELSKKLSDGIPFLRTDFYIINGKIYFGELTFFPASGFKPFVPQIWDKRIGDLLDLPIA